MRSGEDSRVVFVSRVNQCRICIFLPRIKTYTYYKTLRDWSFWRRRPWSLPSGMWPTLRRNVN